MANAYTNADLCSDSIVRTILASPERCILLRNDEESIPTTLECMLANMSERGFLVVSAKRNRFVRITKILPVVHGRDAETGSAPPQEQALDEIFRRWCGNGGNKNHAKGALSSIRFLSYLDSIGYFDADYAIFADWPSDVEGKERRKGNEKRRSA